MTAPMERHDVAVVVILRATGADQRDAGNRATYAVRRAVAHQVLTDGGHVQHVTSIQQLHHAIANGYITAGPTGRATREAGLS